ncbi:HNH endonuclease [Pseudonocardia dioxanivorans]|uniref:HNH endonuclease n=1 Tax=Pseudonocardia TaxID=1847 RepID=UPI001F1F4AA9
MHVLKRDGFRCVICGRRPRGHEDIELHVHHVLPWRFFDPTAEWNLATLCGTCHKGLDRITSARFENSLGCRGRSIPVSGTRPHFATG